MAAHGVSEPITGTTGRATASAHGPNKEKDPSWLARVFSTHGSKDEHMAEVMQVLSNTSGDWG